MLNLRFLTGRSRSAGADSPEREPGWQAPRSAQALLATPYRQQLIKAVRESISLTPPVYEAYVECAIERYAQFVQLLPASEYHHHSYPGGMLDHGLETCVYALRLRRQHLLPPSATSEEQSSAGELWSVAVVYASLMHDVAKSLVDIDIQLTSGQRWCLWAGDIPEPYRVKYRRGRDYFLHSAINPLVCQRVIGVKGLEWLSTQPMLFGMFMYAITGHAERSGVIGDIVSHADKASVAKSLGGNVAKLTKAPVKSLQSKLRMALTYVVKENLRLNDKGAQAFLTQEALWLVTPLVPREMKSYLLANGFEGIPSNDTRLYDEMQAHGLILENPSGKAIWQCEVRINDWVASLSMLKVNRSIIWGDDEAPECFSGSVEAHHQSDSSVQEMGDTTIVGVPPYETGASQSGCGKSKKVSKKRHDKLIQKGEGSHDKGDEKLERELIGIAAGEPGKAEGNDIAKADCAGETGVAQSGGETDKGGKPDGEAFWEWLQVSLAMHKLVMNDSKAMVHTVEGCFYIVSPRIFKRYCQEVFGDETSWKVVQEGFQKLKLHKKNEQGGSFHRVKVVGPNNKSSILNGYLIKEDAGLNGKGGVVDNPFLSLLYGGRGQ